MPTAKQVAEAERRKAVAAVGAQQETAMVGERATAKVRAAQAEADNLLDEGSVAMRVKLAKLEALPRVVAEMVKPAEKIDSIRIQHVSGLGHGGTGGEGAARPPINPALGGMLEIAVQRPALKKLGEDLGMSLDGGMVGVSRGLTGATRAADRSPTPPFWC